MHGVKIPFNKPYMTGRELAYIEQAHALGRLSGDGTFTKKCNAWLEQHIGCKRALLTHSCTAALEMAALLIDVQPGDEIIMPSYTFVSTANAFVLRGGVPVFVDIRPDTLNIDESKIEAAITARTRAIVPVHYAGVGCEMDVIMEIAEKHGLFVIEDAAQGIMSSYKGRPLGSIGHLAALSFHETKNIISGEGGALLINDETFIDRAEIIREKGTNRSQFFRGQIDKYTWTDIGSSYLPGEAIAAFLWAQMEEAENITRRRLAIWDRYNVAFEGLPKACGIHGPGIPSECQHNAHMYYLILPNLTLRSEYIKTMNRQEIGAIFHYVPLHSSSAGRKYGKMQGELSITTSYSDRLVRLPLWVELSPTCQDEVIRMTYNFFSSDELVQTAR
jgi:dTDP-4-amino-4,6-dideoxygalactose transaminase